MAHKDPELSFILTVKSGEKAWDFVVSSAGFTLGRTEDSQVVLPLPALSRVHLQFQLHEGRWLIWDCGSSNGTYIKSKKLESQKRYIAAFPLEIQFGQSTLVTLELQEKSTGIQNPPPEIKTPKQVTSVDEVKPEKPTPEISAQKAEKIYLENEVNKLEEKRKKALDEYESLKAGHVSLQKQLREAEEKITQLNSEKSLLEEDISSLIENQKNAKKEAETKQGEVSAITKELDSLWRAREERREELRLVELKKEEEKKALSSLEDSLSKAQKQLQETESQNESILKRAQKAEEDQTKLEKSIKELESQIKELRSSHQQADKDEKRARETLEAETKKLTETKNQVELAETQKKRLESALDGVRSELVVAEEKLKSAIKSREENEKIYHSHKNEIETLSLNINTKKREYEDLISKNKGLSESHTQAVAQLKSELLKLEESEKNRLKENFIKQAQQQEIDLAEKQKKTLGALEQEKLKWHQERDSRRPNEIKEIMRAGAEIFEAHLQKYVLDINLRNKVKEDFSKDLKEILKTVLNSSITSTQHTTHLKSLLAASPEAQQATQKYWKVKSYQVGAVAVIALVLILVPSIPRTIIGGLHTMVTREPAGANAFVEQARLARANRPKFLPDMDREFRDNYTDNILYVQGYAELKSNDEIKSEWTKELNKFLQEKLEFNDRAIVSYMAIEGPLVAELTLMRSQIELHNQNEKIEKMREIENSAVSRLEELLKGSPNFLKVKDFEKSFYQKYADRF